MTTLGSAVLKLTVDSSGLDSGFREAEQTANTRVADIGKTMSMTVTPAILGIGAAVFAATENINEAMATIRTGTGETGQALQDLKADFHEVFGEVNASSQTVAQTIADFNTRLGITGTALQDATRKAVEMADAMGEDVQGVVDGTARAMQVFGVEGDQASLVLDKLFVASQQGGIGVNELAASLQTYGPVLANANIGMDQSIALFTNMEAKGVDISRVMPGLNAYFRRTAETATELGKGSEYVSEEFETLIQRIADTEDNAEALNIATEAFGAEGAQRLLTAVKAGAFELGEMEMALDGSEGAIDANTDATRTLSERLNILKNRVVEGISQGWDKLPGPLQASLTAFGGMLAATGPLLTAFPGLVTAVNLLAAANIRETAARIAATTATVAGTVATTAFGVAMNLALGPVGLVIAAAAALALGIIALANNWDTVKEKTLGAVDAIWGKIEPVFNLIKKAYDSKLGWILPGGALIKGLDALNISWETVWDKIEGVFDTVMQNIKKFAGPVLKIIGVDFGAETDKMQEAATEDFGKVDTAMESTSKGADTFTGDVDTALNSDSGAGSKIRKFVDTGKSAVDELKESWKYHSQKENAESMVHYASETVEGILGEEERKLTRLEIYRKNLEAARKKYHEEVTLPNEKKRAEAEADETTKAWQLVEKGFGSADDPTTHAGKMTELSAAYYTKALSQVDKAYNVETGWYYDKQAEAWKKVQDELGDAEQETGHLGAITSSYATAYDIIESDVTGAHDAIYDSLTEEDGHFKKLETDTGIHLSNIERMYAATGTAVTASWGTMMTALSGQVDMFIMTQVQKMQPLAKMFMSTAALNPFGPGKSPQVTGRDDATFQVSVDGGDWVTMSHEDYRAIADDPDRDFTIRTRYVSDSSVLNYGGGQFGGFINDEVWSQWLYYLDRLMADPIRAGDPRAFTRGDLGLGEVGSTPPMLPGLPALAGGGIATRAVTALIGEAGPEPIIPLDRLDSMLSDAYNAGGMPSHVTLMVGDREFDAYIQEAQLEGSRRGRQDV